MNRHIAYLKYMLRHKWFVYKACGVLGVSKWRALLHDWHKFLPSEWIPYAETFYKSDGSKQYVESAAFSRAWNLHQKRGKHHWQHWLITWDRGVTEPLEMSEPYVREMVADWYGAGKGITGHWAADEWYEKNKEKIKLHPNSEKRVWELFAQWNNYNRVAFNLGMATIK
jgi:hypothetical protein